MKPDTSNAARLGQAQLADAVAASVERALASHGGCTELTADEAQAVGGAALVVRASTSTVLSRYIWAGGPWFPYPGTGPFGGPITLPGTTF